MNLWLVAAATAAITAPGPPPPKPHMHYEIRINRHLTDADRLQAACDVAHYLSDDLKKKQRRPDQSVLLDAQALLGIVCAP